MLAIRTTPFVLCLISGLGCQIAEISGSVEAVAPSFTLSPGESKQLLLQASFIGPRFTRFPESEGEIEVLADLNGNGEQPSTSDAQLILFAPDENRGPSDVEVIPTSDATTAGWRVSLYESTRAFEGCVPARLCRAELKVEVGWDPALDEAPPANVFLQALASANWMAPSGSEGEITMEWRE